MNLERLTRLAALDLSDVAALTALTAALVRAGEVEAGSSADAETTRLILARCFGGGDRLDMCAPSPSILSLACGGDLKDFHRAASRAMVLMHGDYLYPDRTGTANASATKRLRDLMRAISTPCLSRFNGSTCAVYQYRAPLSRTFATPRMCATRLSESKARSRVWAD